MRHTSTMRFDSKNHEKKKNAKTCAKHLATPRPTTLSGTKTSAFGKTAARPLPTRESAVKTYDVIFIRNYDGKPFAKSFAGYRGGPTDFLSVSAAAILIRPPLINRRGSTPGLRTLGSCSSQ